MIDHDSLFRQSFQHLLAQALRVLDDTAAVHYRGNFFATHEYFVGAQVTVRSTRDYLGVLSLVQAKLPPDALCLLTNTARCHSVGVVWDSSERR